MLSFPTFAGISQTTGIQTRGITPRFGNSPSQPASAKFAIPDSWPDSLKTLFQNEPDNRLSLDDFKYTVKDAKLVHMGTRLAYFMRQIPGTNHFWEFATRVTKGNAEAPSGAVHALTLVQGPDGKEYVHFVREARVPIAKEGADGRIEIKSVIQCPAGIMDKPDADLLSLCMAEVNEETPYRPVATRVLSSGPIPATPGAVTEHKAFLAVRAVYDPEKARQDLREGDELILTKRGLDIPLADFLDRTRFLNWVKSREALGEEIGQDVFAVRGMIL